MDPPPRTGVGHLPRRRRRRLGRRPRHADRVTHRSRAVRRPAGRPSPQAHRRVLRGSTGDPPRPAGRASPPLSRPRSLALALSLSLSFSRGGPRLAFPAKKHLASSPTRRFLPSRLPPSLPPRALFPETMERLQRGSRHPPSSGRAGPSSSGPAPTNRPGPQHPSQHRPAYIRPRRSVPPSLRPSLLPPSLLGEAGSPVADGPCGRASCEAARASLCPAPHARAGPSLAYPSQRDAVGRACARISPPGPGGPGRQIRVRTPEPDSEVRVGVSGSEHSGEHATRPCRSRMTRRAHPFTHTQSLIHFTGSVKRFSARGMGRISSLH
jgi:hypothetical protein